MKKVFTLMFVLVSMQLFAQNSPAVDAVGGEADVISFQDAITTFPNPVVKELHISVSNSNFNVTNVQLFDLLGNVVYEEEIVVPSETIKIDLSEKESEVYLLMVYDDTGGRVTKRIIKK
jgi:hypothetical protein